MSHDIKFYLSLDKDENSVEFWRAMLIVCEDKLSEMDPARTEQSVVAPHIAQDIAAKLAGKTHEELTLLQGQIQRKLAGGGAIDVDYWEALLKTLIVWKAKVRSDYIMPCDDGLVPLQRGLPYSLYNHFIPSRPN